MSRQPPSQARPAYAALILALLLLPNLGLCFADQVA